MTTFSIRDCIRYGWQTFEKRPWILIGAPLLAFAIGTIPTLFVPNPTLGPGGELIDPPFDTYYAITSFISLVASIYVSLALTTFSLRAHDDVEAVQIEDLWNPGAFWRFLGAYILALIVVSLGFLAFVIPGVILAVGFSFVPFLVVDRGLGPIEALKESRRITKGHKWKLFGLMLALMGVSLVGTLALVVGLFVALPVTMIAYTHAYRTLTT